ncbi:MAG TPA: hypothetical protein VFE40_04930 [Jatrophihabitantaceae bacterium]|nr:hypothetical protein [Amycolatopsis sp.]HZY75643.1 hypothetical protein [Jatrophihabitantaceae bacterium]
MTDPLPWREGRATIVFDVPDRDVPEATAVVAGWLFDVRPYYPDASSAATPGWTRLAAERELTQFTDLEVDGIAAEFRRRWDAAQLAGDIVATEQWTAGGDGGSGVREPRRPIPVVRTGAVAVADR